MTFEVMDMNQNLESSFEKFENTNIDQKFAESIGTDQSDTTGLIRTESQVVTFAGKKGSNSNSQSNVAGPFLYYLRNKSQENERLASKSYIATHLRNQNEIDRKNLIAYRALFRRLSNDITIKARLASRSTVHVEQLKNEDAIFQPHLELDSDFVPSQQLIDIWVRGVKSHFEEAQDEGQLFSEILSNINDNNFLVREFFYKLRDIIINYAISKEGNTNKFIICLAGRFLVTFQDYILGKFFVRPDEGTEFFALLAAELIDWLRVGNQIQGDWGALVTDGGSTLVIDIDEFKNTKTRGFAASNED